MVISAEPLIYGLIFLGVLGLVQGIYLVVFGKSISLNNRVNRRLDMLEKGAGREQVLEQLRKEMSQHMKSKSIPLYSMLAEKAQKANIAGGAESGESCKGKTQWYSYLTPLSTVK